jgi:hypothetical protein
MSNGLGPWWFPASVRKALTNLGKTFFDEASWDKHDEGYERGFPSRSECDRKFLMAMLRDASLQQTTLRAWICTKAAFFLWACVRVGGGASYGRNR